VERDLGVPAGRQPAHAQNDQHHRRERRAGDHARIVQPLCSISCRRSSHHASHPARSRVSLHVRRRPERRHGLTLAASRCLRGDDCVTTANPATGHAATYWPEGFRLGQATGSPPRKPGGHRGNSRSSRVPTVSGQKIANIAINS